MPCPNCSCEDCQYEMNLLTIEGDDIEYEVHYEVIIRMLEKYFPESQEGKEQTIRERCTECKEALRRNPFRMHDGLESDIMTFSGYGWDWVIKPLNPDGDEEECKRRKELYYGWIEEHQEEIDRLEEEVYLEMSGKPHPATEWRKENPDVYW